MTGASGILDVCRCIEAIESKDRALWDLTQNIVEANLQGAIADMPPELFDEVIAGNLRCDSGTIHLQGEDITALSADQRCRAGIGRTFQIPLPFAGLSVYENALVAATYGAGEQGMDDGLATPDPAPHRLWW